MLFIIDDMKIVNAEEAVSVVKSNESVFFQGAAMTPNLLIDTLCERYKELSNVQIIQIHTMARPNTWKLRIVTLLMCLVVLLARM